VKNVPIWYGKAETWTLPLDEVLEKALSLIAKL